MGSIKNGESQSASTELAFRCKSCALIAGGIMAKNPRYYHTAVHKNITRDRFIRSVNPIVAEKMRAILEELKRKICCLLFYGKLLYRRLKRIRYDLYRYQR